MNRIFDERTQIGDAVISYVVNREGEEWPSVYSDKDGGARIREITVHFQRDGYIKLVRVLTYSVTPFIDGANSPGSVLCVHSFNLIPTQKPIPVDVKGLTPEEIKNAALLAQQALAAVNAVPEPIGWVNALR